MARLMKDSGIPWIGEIPTNWSINKVFRLFCTIGSGTTPKSGESQCYGGSNNWIQSGDINGSYLSVCKTKVTDFAIQNYSALRIYEAPFIIIAMYGASIGNLSISNISGCVNQACCVIQGGKQDIVFSFYALKISKDYLIWKAVHISFIYRTTTHRQFPRRRVRADRRHNSANARDRGGVQEAETVDYHASRYERDSPQPPHEGQRD